jgi:hypothetical protein
MLFLSLNYTEIIIHIDLKIPLVADTGLGPTNAREGEAILNVSKPVSPDEEVTLSEFPT